MAGGEPESDEALARSTCVTVISPTLNHNALFRTHEIVTLLSRHYRVQLVAFGRSGDVYPPLADEPLMRPELTYHSENLWGWHRQLRRMRHAIRGDVIVCVKPLLPSFGAGLLLGRWLRRPVIVDIDDWELGFLKRQPLTRELRDFGRQWITSTSSTFFTHWLDKRILLAKSVLVSNAVLQGMYGGHWIPHLRGSTNLDHEPSPPTKRKIVLFAGQPRAHKGVRTLLEAWRLLDRGDAILRLVVASPERDVEGLGIETLRGVEVAGPLPYSEIPSELARASVVVIPQDNKPGSVAQLPMKLLDAMGAGRPIVSTAVSDIPRWLSGGAGLIVPPGSSRHLAAAVNFLLDNPKQAEAMGRKAREQAIRWASVETISARLKKVVDAVIAGTHAVPDPAFTDGVDSPI